MENAPTFPSLDSTGRCRQACAIAAILLLPAWAAAQGGLSLSARGVQGLSVDGLDLGVGWDAGFLGGQPLNLVAGRSVVSSPPGLPQGPLLPQLAPAFTPAFTAQRFFPDELGFVGLQFRDGARLTLRRQNGGLGLSYRASF